MKKMSRRDLLKGMGAAGMLAMAGPLASLAACAPNNLTGSTPSPSSSPTTANPDCILAPEETEGPYYIDSAQMRQDITDGRSGAPMRLMLTVVNARTCAVIPNAMVDVWHADAEGVYSAYPGQGDSRNVDTSGQKFLRGVQVTGENGQVSFTSIYPGWYRGRTTHIHFKVHFNNNTLVTSQLYFPESVNESVYGSESAYTARGQKDTPNASDMVYLPTNLGERTVLKVNKESGIYVASLVIGVAA